MRKITQAIPSNIELGRILFVLLALPVTLFLGMAFAGLTGLADHQGLAGGAIVLGYGVLFAVAGLILSLVMVRRLSASTLRFINVSLLIAIVGIGIFAWFRIQSQMKGRSDAEQDMQAVPMRMNASPSSPGEMGMGYFKPNVFDHPVLYVFGPPARGKTIQDLSPQSPDGNLLPSYCSDAAWVLQRACILTSCLPNIRSCDTPPIDPLYTPHTHHMLSAYSSYTFTIHSPYTRHTLTIHYREGCTPGGGKQKPGGNRHLAQGSQSPHQRPLQGHLLQSGTRMTQGQ